MLCCVAGKGSGIPRVASLFMKANRNWLNEQIEIMLDHFFNEYVICKLLSVGR